MRQATENFNPAPSLNMDLLDAIQLPPRRSIDPITFSPSLSLPSPSSVAPMGLFSQPMDLPSLQTYASIAMSDLVVDGDFEKSSVATSSAGGQVGASAGKSAWNPDYAFSNVLIHTPTDEAPGHLRHQMVPCTPGPATAQKGLIMSALGPLDGAQVGGYQGSEVDDSRDYFLHGVEKGTFEQEAFLFGSSDEDAVSGEIQLNHVTGQYVNVFDEGNSPALIHSAALTLSKKSKARAATRNTKSAVPMPTKKSARTAASRARKLMGDPSALTVGKNGDVADGTIVSAKAASTRSSVKVASSAAQRSEKLSKTLPVSKSKTAMLASLDTKGLADIAGQEIDVSLLSSQDLKTPISSQQSQGSQRASGKKPSRKTLAGRPVKTPITKKLGKAGKKSIIRRAILPWIFGTVTCPRTGVELREGGVPPAVFCTQCRTTDTPVWRAGPFGHKTLCNACGVRWMKQLPSQRMK